MMSIEVFGISIFVIIMIVLAIAIWELYIKSKPETSNDKVEKEKRFKLTQERPVDVPSKVVKTNDSNQNVVKSEGILNVENKESNPTEIPQELKEFEKDETIELNPTEISEEVKDIEIEEITELKLVETLQEELEIEKPKLKEKYTKI